MNYTLLLFKPVVTGMISRFELPLADHGMGLLRKIVKDYRLITFNGSNYDIPLLMLILKGADSATIKKASDRIIVHNAMWWVIEREFNVKCNPPELDHVDLMNVAPLTGSLKLYGGRLHSKSIQDLPIAPSATITEEQKPLLRSYCENDCDTLIDLFHALTEQMALREEMSERYGIDLTSKSDAQIAEAVIKKEVESITHTTLERPGADPGHRFHYTIPSWMGFQHLTILESIRDAWFVIGDDGKVLMPLALDGTDIMIAGRAYRMGVGGLHSMEKKQTVLADASMRISDFDMVSYYPSILLNQQLYPKHIGPEFLNVYQRLVTTRLDAKKAGNKAVSESLKITINGTFGKTSNRWSVLYAPDLFIQIVLTGQLALLMLIERLNIAGVEVVSANTDGVTVFYHASVESDVVEAVKVWEMITEFETERVDYSSVYSRDVSNYIAIKIDGGTKEKGVAGVGLDLHKNPNARICAEAVIDYLQFGASIRSTIESCDDLRKFVCVRKVTGGATWHGKDIGKICRWYYSRDEEESILYKTNSYLVPKTLKARPLVEMPNYKVPEDLDRELYIHAANKMLSDFGGANAVC